MSTYFQKLNISKIGAVTVLLLAAFSFTQNAQAQSAHGVFKVVKGDVTVTSKDGKEQKAKLGGKVLAGDTIQSGKDSRAKIVMVDKNEINISPDSKITIENYVYKPEANEKSVVMNVLYGKMRTKVNQKYDGEKNTFNIKTKSAVAGVRGTDFITGFDPKKNATKIVTFEGRVQFGNLLPNGQISAPVFVGPGQTTEVVGVKPPPAPTEIPKTELVEFDKSSDAERTPASTPDQGAREPEKRDNDRGQKEGESTADKDKGIGNDKKQEPADKQAANGPAAPTPASDAAVVAGDTPKSDAPKSDAPKGDSPAAGKAPPPQARMPAAMPPMAPPSNSMILPSDLPSSGPIFMPPPNVGMLPPPPPNMQPIYAPPPCDICNTIIENKKATVVLTVKPGN